MRRLLSGFSLIELMVVIALMAIIAGLAGPSFISFLDRSRLRGAADSVASLVASARGGAVKSGRDVAVYLVAPSGGAAWCIGANEAVTPTAGNAYAAPASCACNTSNSCLMDGIERVVRGSDAGGVSLVGSGWNLTFDGKLGLSSSVATRTLILESPRGDYRLQLNVSPVGQATICDPIGANKADETFPGVGACS